VRQRTARNEGSVGQHQDCSAGMQKLGRGHLAKQLESVLVPCIRVLASYNYIPSVFSVVACTSGCTVGPLTAFCAVAEGTGARVVVFVGALVGYLRAAEPAAFAPLEAEEPIIFVGNWSSVGLLQDVEMRGDNRGRGDKMHVWNFVKLGPIR
jgi:hypothetical protein